MTEYTEQQGDEKPETLYGMTPADLGLPEDFNAYQAQKKRIKKILRNIELSQEQLTEMAILYDTYSETPRAGVCELMKAALEEQKQMILEFYVNHM